MAPVRQDHGAEAGGSLKEEKFKASVGNIQNPVLKTKSRGLGI